MVKVNDEASPCRGRMGRLIRVFYRAGEPWVRLRDTDGLCFFVPWSKTHLPPLFASPSPKVPRLSARSLLDLVHQLNPDGAACLSGSKKPSSR
jgi:hypothetical protein